MAPAHRHSTPSLGKKPPRPPLDRGAWLICAALVATVAIIYGQMLGHDFVLLDDDIYVSANPLVHNGFSLEGIVHAFAGRYDWNWHPLTWMSHTLDGQLFGLHAGGHHLTSMLLHALNVCLLFRLLDRTTGRRAPSALAAGLWAVHPFHVEVVAWISARKDLLSTCLGLLTLHAYASYAKRANPRRYLGVVLLFVLGLLCKPMLVTLPAVLLLLDFWPLRRLELGREIAQRDATAPACPRVSLKRALIEKLPLVGLAGLSAFITFTLQRNIGAMTAAGGVPFIPRLENAIVSYARYLGKTLWPNDLGVLYPHPELAGGQSLTAWQIGLAAALLVGVTVAVLASRRGYGWVGWFWFFGTLIPVIGLVQIGGQSMADRYTYLPNIGLYIGVAWTSAELVKRGRRRWPALEGMACAAAAAVLVLLAGRAHQQAATWRDTPSLYRNAVAVEPNNILAHFGLAKLLAERGEDTAAMVHLREVLRVKPDDADSHNLMAIVLLRRGKPGPALDAFARAAQAEPNNARYRYNLGLALEHLRQLKPARIELERAVALDPDYGAPRGALARVLSKLAQHAAKQGQYAEAARLTDRGATILRHKHPEAAAALRARAKRFRQRAAATPR